MGNLGEWGGLKYRADSYLRPFRVVLVEWSDKKYLRHPQKTLFRSMGQNPAIGTDLWVLSSGNFTYLWKAT